MEWKFERSSVYMAYIDKTTWMCYPFNLIPTPYGIYMFVMLLIDRCAKRENYKFSFQVIYVCLLLIK